MIHPFTLTIVGACVALAACSQSAETPNNAPTPSPTMMPVEPNGGNGSGAPPIPDASSAGQFERTMPVRLRGDWHSGDRGRAPTSVDCDPRLRGTIHWDRIITVNEGGYSYFETGGRIMEGHNRTGTFIDATFDTTYADEPTQARKDFALQNDGTMAVNDDDGDGRLSVRTYIRCPEGSGT